MKNSIFIIIVFYIDNIKIGNNTIEPDSDADSTESTFE